MRHWFAVLAATGTVLASTVASAQAAPLDPPPPAASRAAATTNGADSGWTRIVEPPLDDAAGVLCDFAIHADPIVNNVWFKVLQRFPDGSVKSEIGTGPLVYRVHNLTNNKTVDVDASADGLIVFHTDGSFDYYLHGPVIASFQEGSGNLPRGLYALDGKFYTVHFAPDRHKTVSLRGVKVHNVCPDLA